MVVDLVEETERRLAALRAGRCRRRFAPAMRPVAAFSAPIAEVLAGLRSFLHAHMYSHYKVKRMSLKAQRIVEELFDGLLREPDCLPPALARARRRGRRRRARSRRSPTTSPA